MHNGIGLPTARGSGTSGYVQKNLSYLKQKRANTNYKQILQQFKDNPAPAKKRANNEIIEHELKHKIEVELFDYTEQLKEKGIEAGEIEKLVKEKRESLNKKLLRNDNQIIE